VFPTRPIERAVVAYDILRGALSVSDASPDVDLPDRRQAHTRQPAEVARQLASAAGERADGGHERAAGRFVREVGAKGPCLRAKRSRLGYRLGSAVSRSAVVNCHIEAMACEFERNLAAETVRRAGDEHGGPGRRWQRV